MTFGINTKNSSSPNSQLGFRAKKDTSVAAPIASVQASLEQGVDTFADKINEKKDKKSTKTAIAVGSTVVLLSGMLALLNPRYSPKVMAKLKSLQQQAAIEIEKNRNNYFKSKFYKGYKATMEGIAKGFNAICNFNSGKDVAFQYMCCDTKKNIHMKNKTIEKAVKWADNIFTKIFKKPHEWITGKFDNISKATVKGKYKSVNKKIVKLEEAINQAKQNLAPEQRALVDAKLAEIQKLKSYLSEEEILKRLANQNDMMQNVERDFMKNWRRYKNGFSSKFVKNGDHVKKGLNFWAEDSLKTQKNKVVQEGKDAINKLVSIDKDAKGLYSEIYEIFENSLGSENISLIKRRFKQTKAKLKNANISECHEYFDKKRDLILGSAPTDILSALGGLGLCGLAVGTAHSKDERISRLVTTGIPVVVGLTTSLVCTAMLFTAATGLLIGGATGLAANFIGNKIDKHILGNNDEVEENPNLNNPKEVENA